MNKEKRICKEYCTGCGLCHSVYGYNMLEEANGFLEIDEKELTKKTIKNLKQICPFWGKQCKDMDERYLWGRREDIYTAYSSNPEIRFKASTGGILTQIACFLLDKKYVDGVIHIGRDEKDPISSKLYCSRTSEDVVRNCGSRYTSSSPLYGIREYFETDEKYCFIGKPCDVSALRNYIAGDDKLKEKFPYLLSFFCAGAPSKHANMLLLSKMGCSYEDCVDLTYRGNGWPGYATAIDKNAQKYEILYREAWGKTLGRDIRKVCRFCLDGIGEMADISCCDAWYLDQDRKPSFEENEGRNAVFCRTENGRQIFMQACDAGYITLLDYPECEDDLKYAQYHQFFKKGSMYSSILAMKLMLKPSPNYDMKKMRILSRNITTKLKIKKILGTIKRILLGKI